MNNSAQYAMGRSEAETKRLIQNARLYDEMTRRFLLRSGIAKGMRVLDVGSGAGDVALTLAEFVGPDGSVVGVDVDTKILETARDRANRAGFENIQFTAGDVRYLQLSDNFDAVVGRLVLMYIADPADALKQLSTRLRPGGVVAFQEVDLALHKGLAGPETPLLGKLIDWEYTVFERTGAHVDMGTGLYRAFVEAGLPEPTLHLETPIGGAAGWPGYQQRVATFRNLLPLIEKYGIATAEELDIETLAERLRTEAFVAKQPATLPPHITAHAVKAV
ncbi:MAG: methyltransferase domain-containing protein [Rhodospirillales bacterium]|nr:methyltransferase domain-containing protein [Rhodospirillales bacterium]MDE0377670.1 methyltransferase domain-containing protein [Rhodospirillales bacterium]